MRVRQGSWKGKASRAIVPKGGNASTGGRGSTMVGREYNAGDPPAPGSMKIAAIDLERHEVLWKLATGKQPAGIWMTPDDRHLLIGITGESHLEIYDWRARKMVKRILTGLAELETRPPVRLPPSFG